MELILTQLVKGLGKAGDRVKVKDGYARNYLIPGKLALQITPNNLEWFERLRKKEETRLKQEYEQAVELAKKLSESSCTVVVETGEGDRLFGAVTAKDIAETLEHRNSIVVDKRDIELEEPIKQLGVFQIPIRLHPQVKAQVKLWVVKK